MFFTSPPLSRTKTILFPASANATYFAFALTEVIMQLSSNGPHSFKILPLVFITRICSEVDAKIVSPQLERDVTGEGALTFQMSFMELSLSLIHISEPTR